MNLGDETPDVVAAIAGSSAPYLTRHDVDDAVLFLRAAFPLCFAIRVCFSAVLRRSTRSTICFVPSLIAPGIEARSLQFWRECWKVDEWQWHRALPPRWPIAPCRTTPLHHGRPRSTDHRAARRHHWTSGDGTRHGRKDIDRHLASGLVVERKLLESSWLETTKLSLLVLVLALIRCTSTLSSTRLEVLRICMSGVG